MAVLAMMDIKVKPESLEELKAFLRAELGHTRAYDGCQGLTVHSNLVDPNNLVFVGSWESKDHFDKYLAWRQERGDLAKLGAMLAADPNMRQFEIVGV